MDARLCLLLFLLSAAARGHTVEADTFYVSVGHLFLLRCHSSDPQAQVRWTKVGRENSSLPAGVEVRDGLLWFLPVQTTHNGTYTCEKRDDSKTKMTYGVSVSSGEFPDTSENISIRKGASQGLPCKQTEIFSLNATTNVRWMKDGLPVDREENPVFVHEDGFLRLPAAAEGDSGKYTCLIHLSWGGRTYTAARSVQLTVTNDFPDVFPELYVVSPQQDVVIVQVGMRAELQCLAYTGYTEDPEIMMFWTVDNKFTDSYSELNETWKFIHERGRVFGLSTLSISRVLPEFLNFPFECHVHSPVEQKVGVARLQKADHNPVHFSLALCLSAFMAVVALAGCFFLFKVDLILAHRKLMTHFSKQQTSDGKSYDAYVSVVQSEAPGSDEAAMFALQVLPVELEQKHGFSLYIKGRDDCPGEAIHDAVSASLRLCRRLIIILSSDGKTEETSTLCENQNPLCFEQKVGLHDALMQNGPKVILIEIDGPVDYKKLPESLRYIKRKHGALKWRKSFVGTKRPTELYSNQNFWKNLRYHMPPVPTRRHQTV
ncbi:interleukin-1 receptor type 1 isoform 2-T3 [Menidia menidia]